MKLTLEMLLYFIRTLHPLNCGGDGKEKAFSGVKQFYREDGQMQEEYLYVGNLSDTQGCDSQCTFLAVNDLRWGAEELRGLSGHWILVDACYQVPYLMNLMVDIFNRMAGWDKNMHIAVLEGCDVQTLVDISEPILGHFTIIFDASFSVIAYTKKTASDYRGFCKTIEKGYSEAVIMDKIREKQILKQLKREEALIAPSAEDDNQINLYRSFYNGQALLGYACVCYGVMEPDPGYLDIFKLFAENMRFCLKRDYENQRYGQMMYETFLTNLVSSESVAGEQLSEQLRYMDGLQERGRFALASVSFEGTANIPLVFLTRMIARQFWNVRPFLYQNHICLLKILAPQYQKDDIFSQEEMEKIQELLSNYRWKMGISNVFTRITDLRYAYLQSEAALLYGDVPKEGTRVRAYQDYNYFHLFSAMEGIMPVEMFCTEAYLEIKKYDADHGTDYLGMVLCYLGHDCNATHTAEALFIHRNTVRNMVRFVEACWGLDLSDPQTKLQLGLSELAERYLVWKLHANQRPGSQENF